jgi:hypothetical protein
MRPYNRQYHSRIAEILKKERAFHGAKDYGRGVGCISDGSAVVLSNEARAVRRALEYFTFCAISGYFALRFS